MKRKERKERNNRKVNMEEGDENLEKTLEE